MSSQNLIHLLALLACRWLGGRAVAQAGVQSGLSRTAVFPSAVTEAGAEPPWPNSRAYVTGLCFFTSHLLVNQFASI